MGSSGGWKGRLDLIKLCDPCNNHLPYLWPAIPVFQGLPSLSFKACHPCLSSSKRRTVCVWKGHLDLIKPCAACPHRRLLHGALRQVAHRGLEGVQRQQGCAAPCCALTQALRHRRLQVLRLQPGHPCRCTAPLSTDVSFQKKRGGNVGRQRQPLSAVVCRRSPPFFFERDVSFFYRISV